MYTIDDENKNELEDEYYESNFWSNNKGLIVKIIIIILCVIVLIWLFKSLNTNKNVISDNTYMANIDKIRLAAEDYFFIKNKKDNNRIVTVSTLQSEGLTEDIIDGNNKVCDTTLSTASLSKEVDGYTMSVEVTCPSVTKQKNFYYHNNTLACLNCNGNTKMTGNNYNQEKKNNNSNNNTNNTVPINNDNNRHYSCVNWSDWTKTRVYDSRLQERSKTLVQGVKYNNVSRTVYGEWSDYTTTPITSRSDLEVQTKIVLEEGWSSPKTATSVDNLKNIKILNVYSYNDNYNNCENGFIENGVCYSNKTQIGNLTYAEYHSDKYKVRNNTCEGLRGVENINGEYNLTYINCIYNEAIDTQNNTNYYTYEYQQLERTEVVYYRSRTITTVNEQDNAVYTKDKYEEKYLPEGYVKVPGTEETYYSYKLLTCEK